MSNGAAIAAPLPTLRHPLKFVKSKAITLIDLLIFIHVGTLIVVGLYYLAFEVYGPFTEAWHNVGPELGYAAAKWSYVRHMIRDVGEGLLGGYLGQYVVWNHFKKRAQKRINGTPNLIDKIEIALHIPNLKNKARLTGKQFAAAPLLGIIYAVPGFLLALLAVKWFHVHAPTPPATASYGQKVEAIFTGGYDKKIIGLFASVILGRRPMKKVYDDAQLYFVERRVALGKPVRWYHPPTFKARYTVFQREGGATKAVEHTAAFNTAMTAVLLVGVALAGFGYYVLTVIA